MEQRFLDILTYSPTGTSERVALKIAEGILLRMKSTSFEQVQPVSMTRDFSVSEHLFLDSVTIVAAPVYGGRVAETAVSRFRRVQARNSVAVAVVLYGNRDYEDALVELSDLLAERGFNVIAGAAFIGEHSYSRPQMPVAAGRPDHDDLEIALHFGVEIAEKLSSGEPLSSPVLPGHRPYKAKGVPTPQAPVCDTSLCTTCGRCAETCPVGAIDVFTGGASADSSLCTKCCACIRVCPVGALTFDTPYTEMLFRNFSARREPEIFLGIP